MMDRETLDVRLRPARPLLLVPPAAIDPLPRLGGRRSVSHHLYDLVPRLGVHQVEVQLRLTHAGEVAMSLDEPGDHELAFQVDDLRVRANVAFDVGGAAEGGDLVAGNRNRLRL